MIKSSGQLLCKPKGRSVYSYLKSIRCNHSKGGENFDLSVIDNTADDAPVDEVEAMKVFLEEDQVVSNNMTINLDRIFQVHPVGVNGRPLFPLFSRIVEIREPVYMSAVKDVIRRKMPYLGVFMWKNSKEDGELVADTERIHDVGVLAEIKEHHMTRGGALRLVLYGHRRIKMLRTVESDPVIKLEVGGLLLEPYDKEDDIIKATCSVILQTLKEVLTLNPLYKDQGEFYQLSAKILDDPSTLADFAASTTSAQFDEMQDIIADLNVPRKIGKALTLVKRELLKARLQNDIYKQAEKQLVDSSKKVLLVEQLKIIKKELGLKYDDMDSSRLRIREQFENKPNIPEPVRKIIEEEYAKLNSSDSHSSEANINRNYLDLLVSLPWNVYDNEQVNLTEARTILDHDHYGLKDIKDRLLEFIAVKSLLKVKSDKEKASSAKILLLVGPPGVGKTSIAKSMARAMNKKYVRISVGGLNDVAELKGHRRTYVGAMAGKIIMSLKKAKSMNPLILIDEVDKLSISRQGDPGAALLEILDPEQNSAFVDYYLDVPVDLSKVLFVCTANVLETISAPLLDRMEIIRLSGYTESEKAQIAKNYLIPKAKEDNGLLDYKAHLSDDALQNIIKWYCRENGVRNLQRQIDKLYRKLAFDIVTAKQNNQASEEAENKEVHPEDLQKLLGTPPFFSDRMFDVTPVGIVAGLAWTSMGGTTLFIESSYGEYDKESKGGLSTTGQLGDVMKESATISYTFAKKFFSKVTSNLKQSTYDPNFFKHAVIHLHLPEGATKKDGPSAGCAMVCSFLSLAFNTPLIHNLSMTGEISLTGKVLAVGGIKEKLIAAKRSGLTKVIIPELNKRDFDELDSEVKSDIQVVYANNYEDVFKIAFPSIPFNIQQVII